MNQKTQFSMNFAIVRDYATGVLLGIFNRTVMLELPVSPETIVTDGGASSWSVAARGGRRDGSGKITVNEMPAWAVAVANGATVVSSPANASASVGPINDEIGSMSVSLVPTVVGRGVDALVSLEVTKPAVTSGTPAPAEVTMTYFANGAEVKVEGVKIDSSSNPPVAAQMLGLVLARVAVDQDHPAFVVGDKCDFMIRGAHAGRETITFGSNAGEKRDVSIVARSVRGDGNDDFVGEIQIAKAHPGGFVPKMEDNAATNGMEFNFKALDPADGTAPVIIHQDQQ